MLLHEFVQQHPGTRCIRSSTHSSQRRSWFHIALIIRCFIEAVSFINHQRMHTSEAYTASMRNSTCNTQRIAIGMLAVLAVAGFAVRFGFSIEMLQFAGLTGILAWASLKDLSRRVIPNACILAAAGLRIACLGALTIMGKLTAADVAYYVASGVGVGAALLLFSLVFERLTGRESMGGGDVKLYAIAGLYAGAEAAFGVVLLSCVLVLVASAVLTRTSPEENALERTLPFGPAISCALALFLLLG